MSSKIKICEVCNKEFSPTKNDRPNSWAKRKFCSSKCCNSRPNRGQFKDGHAGFVNSHSYSKGHEPWNKGISHLANENNPMWKGEKVGYHALHGWVERNLGKPSMCEHCKKEYTGKSIHWANKSGGYKRNTSDWLRLCAKCHREYDIKNNLINTWQR